MTFLLTEKDWMSQVRHLAGIYRWLVYHTFNSRRSTGGFPDLVLVKAPRIIFAELKSETGKLTDMQKAWLLELEQCPGVERYVWRPDDLDEVGKILSR